MAKILLAFYSDIDENMILKTIEEHDRYYNLYVNAEDEFDIEIVSGLYNKNIDVTRLNADVIVARGLLAIQFKKHLKNVPVIELPITLDDAISCIQELQKKNIHNEPIAVVGIESSHYNARRVSQICKVSIVPFGFHKTSVSNEDISTLLDDIASQGFKYVFGGLRVATMAEEKNLTSAFVQHGRESLWIALSEAKNIALIRRTERERAAQFETVLNYSHEGIISTDIHNKVIHVNFSAGKVLGINPVASIGMPIETILPNPKFIAMLNKKMEYTDELIKIGKDEFVINSAGIPLGNENIGNVITFQNVANVQNTEIKIRSKLYHRGLAAKYSFADILGESAALKEAINKAQVFAKVPSNILIIGNTGTGKELFSQSIHNESSRKKGPFVAVNCAAIPESLMESEFFGYAGGAFTGASKEGKPGYFELAHEGTIFLDEISEIPLNLQGKLLRVIQESEVMRIGHDKIIPIKVRIICATNKDLKVLMSQEKFREDLYYRLSVLQLRLPTLAERGQDIILLARHFIRQHASTFSEYDVSLSSEAEKLLLIYPWEGNIRELRNVCEQLVVLNRTGIISAGEVRSVLPASAVEEIIESAVSESSMPNGFSLEHIQSERNLVLKQAEKDLIIKALKASRYNKAKASNLLGMNRSTLWRKLKEHGIDMESVFSK